MWEYRCHWRWHQSSQGTTIGEWHRNITEWLRHISWVDAEARRALLADTSILGLDSAACTIRPHTRRACILMQIETDVAMRQSTRFKPLVIWISWTPVKNLLFFFFRLWKTSFSTDFFAKEKVKLCAELLLWSSLPVLKKYPSPASQKVVFWSLFFVEFCFRKCRLSKNILLNIKLLLSPFDFLHFLFEKQTLLQFFNCPLNFQFFCVISARNNPQTNRCQKKNLQTFLNFLEEGHILNKKLFKNYHLNILKKERNWFLQQTFLSINTGVDDRMRHSVVIDLARGTSGASSHLSFFCFFFFWTHKSWC